MTGLTIALLSDLYRHERRGPNNCVLYVETSQTKYVARIGFVL